jgi:hypothetical protein
LQSSKHHLDHWTQFLLLVAPASLAAQSSHQISVENSLLVIS